MKWYNKFLNWLVGKSKDKYKLLWADLTEADEPECYHLEGVDTYGQFHRDIVTLEESTTEETSWFNKRGTSYSCDNSNIVFFTKGN